MFIYLIVNRETGKYYVGQHKGNDLRRYLQKKISQSRHSKGNSHLFASMRKHLPYVWSIHALRSDIQDKVELDQTEKDFIKFLRATDPEFGYNICHGGEGFTGPHTPVAKAKVTEALKQRWEQPGFREHWNQIMKGHPTSPETIGKIKAARAVQDETPRVEGCRRYAEAHQEEMSARLSHEIHVLGGKAGSREAKQRAGRLGAERGMAKAQHVRWHVNRGLVNPKCLLCGLSPSLAGTEE